MAFRIQIRRDTSTIWGVNNPILLVGEFGYETNTSLMKIGDGTTYWNNLSYWNPYDVVNASVYRNGLEILTGVTGFNFTGSSVSGITGANGFVNITIAGGTGSTGNVGPTGAGGTGANTFYGSQTITGTTGTLILANYVLYNFPNDIYAATGGIPLGGIYHNSGAVRIRLT